MLPFAVVELVLHRRLLNEVAGHFLSQAEEPGAARVRFGLLRVRLAFPTFLVFGAFCTIAFANVFYVYLNRSPKNIMYTMFVGLMTSFAISMSSLLIIFAQIILIMYDRIFGSFRYKWIFVGVLMAIAALFALEIKDFVIENIMFSQISGESRSMQYYFGIREIIRHPMFGVGLDRWANAYWLSQKTDNFWLGLTLRYGIPAFCLLVLMFLTHFTKIAKAEMLDHEEYPLRTGYLISFASSMGMFFITGLFGSSLVFFMMYVGAGAWFYNPTNGYPSIATSRQAKAHALRGVNPTRGTLRPAPSDRTLRRRGHRGGASERQTF
jgi:hypothetical protein